MNANIEPLKEDLKELRKQFQRDFEDFVETASNYMAGLKKELSDKTLENESLRQDFSYNLNQIQIQVQRSYNETLESTRKLMMLDYDRRIA